MKLNLKDFRTYQNDGVIRVKNVFSRIEIVKLKRKINSYIKKNVSVLKGKEINFIKKEVNSVHLFKDLFF